MKPVSLIQTKSRPYRTTLWRGGQESRTPFGESRIEGLSILGHNHAAIPSDTAPHDDYTAHQNNNNPEIVGTVIDSIHRNGARTENPYDHHITPKNPVKSFCGQLDARYGKISTTMRNVGFDAPADNVRRAFAPAAENQKAAGYATFGGLRLVQGPGLPPMGSIADGEILSIN